MEEAMHKIISSLLAEVELNAKRMQRIINILRKCALTQKEIDAFLEKLTKDIEKKKAERGLK